VHPISSSRAPYLARFLRRTCHLEEHKKSALLHFSDTVAFIGMFQPGSESPQLLSFLWHVQDTVRFRNPASSVQFRDDKIFTAPAVCLCSFGQVEMGNMFAPYIAYAYEDGWYFNEFSTSIDMGRCNYIAGDPQGCENDGQLGTMVAWNDGSAGRRDSLWATFRFYNTSSTNWCMLQSQYQILGQQVENGPLGGSPSTTQLLKTPFPVDVYFNGSFVPVYAKHTPQEYPYLYVSFPEMADRFDVNISTWTDIFKAEGALNSSISTYLKQVVENNTQLRNKFSVVPYNSVALLTLQRNSIKTLNTVQKLLGLPSPKASVSALCLCIFATGADFFVCALLPQFRWTCMGS
jgi:hypothetical protein